MEMQPCRVLEPLRHDGVDYAPEDVVALDPPTAAPLVRAGVVAVRPVAASPASGRPRRAAPASAPG